MSADAVPMIRRAGVLLPVSALEGAGPIGDLDAAIPWLDWMASADFAVWQILPLVPTDGLGSPYNSASALSGNPLLCGLEPLISAGLLAESSRLPATAAVDYAKAEDAKRQRILSAAERLIHSTDHPWCEEFREFREHAGWARDAALFQALKSVHGRAPWSEWPEALRGREPTAMDAIKQSEAEVIACWQAALFFFERQWKEVRQHAASLGILILGDVPLYVAHDSVDVWAAQDQFQLDAAGQPCALAGVPPDAYSETGQLWGNPLFRWEVMEADGYRWWIERMQRCLEHCDVLRIDHFIGFSRYWSVPASATEATVGTWKPGPGRKVFDALEEALGGLPFIAEDLGPVGDATVALRDALNLPGMKVLLFGLEGDEQNLHRPDNHPKRAVAYPSTHDSDTARGWWEGLGPRQRAQLDLGDTGEEAARAMCDLVLASRAAWAVLPLQDILGLGSRARMNVPGTTEGNWAWRQPPGAMTDELAQDLRQRVGQSDRVPLST